MTEQLWLPGFEKYGPDIEGAVQIRPGLYRCNTSLAAFTRHVTEEEEKDRRWREMYMCDRRRSSVLR